MDHAAYEVESRIEETHWWFTVRRMLFKKIIEGLRLPAGATILDVGTSTGTNLRMLRDAGYGNVRGLDLHDEAIRWCAKKGLENVEKGDICAMPFASDSFDLVLSTDIIEHVDDDLTALREVFRVLKAGGRAIVTVPAFPALWGLQDEVSQHKRRYRKGELLKKIGAAGFTVHECFYFNYLLFAPIWLARNLIQTLKMDLKSENELNSRFTNRLLTMVFTADVVTARRLKIPFGVSILAVVSKQKTEIEKMHRNRDVSQRYEGSAARLGR